MILVPPLLYSSKPWEIEYSTKGVYPLQKRQFFMFVEQQVKGVSFTKS